MASRPHPTVAIPLGPVSTTSSPPKGVNQGAGNPPENQPRRSLPEQEITRYDVDSSLSDTATNSSDEFWDEDDEEKKKDEEKKIAARRGRRAWLLFLKLARPIRTLIFACIGGGILITPLLVFMFHFPRSPARPHVIVWSLWLSISWAAGSLTSLIVDLIPRVIVGIITTVYGKPPEKLKTKLELFMAIAFWLKLALDVSWSWIALSVIRTIRDPPGTYWVYVNRVMQALFSASLIIVAEKLFLRFVAVRFHEKALAERLAENAIALKALDKLSNAQPTAKKSPYGRKRGHKSPGGSRNVSVDALGDLHTAQNSGSNSPDVKGEKWDGSTVKDRRRKKKKSANAFVEQLGDAIGQVALKDSKFNRGGDFGSLQSARKLARKLFSALSDVYPPRSHLIVDDFYPYFKTEEDAKVAFQVFDKDNNGDINKKEMREAVQNIYRERKALSASLKDVGNAVAKLDGVLLAVAFIIIAFICLLIFNRQSTLESLVPLATIILGFSFIFGRSAALLFESLIFIFSTHVFDVGDLVMIDDQPLFVKEFGLFSTVFRRVDGQEIIAPNALLASAKLIHNVRRSGSMWETTKLNVAYDTPLEVIEQLKLRMKAYVAANHREWADVIVNIDKMEFQNAIHLVVAMEHRANWQNWGGRWERRNAFMRHFKTVLEELEIGYSLPIQPVYFQNPPPNSFMATAPSYQAMASTESLGNAGGFQSSGRGGSMGPPSLRVGPDHF